MSPALNFQARFARQVERGEKRQTIRARRKDGRDPKVGDRLYLYTGMRTRQCRKLGEANVESVEPLEITGMRGGEVWMRDRTVSRVVRASVRLLVHDASRLAKNDGFRDLADMLGWFEKTHGLPFEGLLIRWRLEAKP